MTFSSIVFMNEVIILIAIAAVDNSWGIGRNNGLLLSIPEDMKFFRKMTLGKTVILGKKNLESFPSSKPLPKRRNIVLSTTLEAGDELKNNPDFIIVRNIDEMQRLLAGTDEDDIFVIGGGEIYRQLLPFCSKAYITKMHADLNPDCYFPNLDTMVDWAETEKSETFIHNGIEYEFTTYERI